MFHNEYTPFFRKIPLTIQDQSDNLLQFFDSKPSFDLPKIDSRSSVLSETTRRSLLHEFKSIPSHLSNTLIRKVSQELLSFPPSIFQRRTFIGFTDFSSRNITSIPFTKRHPSFDEDGNFSLFTLFIVLEANSIHSPLTCQITSLEKESKRFMLTTGMAILIDHRINFSMPLNPNGYCILMQCKCLYSLLPDSAFTLPIYDQIVLWRGRMRKCFMNSGTFVSNYHSKMLPIDVSHLEDIHKDQCESCLQFIPITSTSCPFCGDRLVTLSFLVTERQKGIWVARSLY